MLRRHCRGSAATRDEVAVTVLDLPVVGRDRDDAWARVERLRGRDRRGGVRTAYACRHRSSSSDRYAALRDVGVSTVFVGVRGLAGPDEVLASPASTL